MDDDDAGVDRDEVLRRIAGAIPMEEPLPEALPEEPEPAPPAPEVPPLPAPARALPTPTWWALHRHELAGLVTAGIALVWISLGIATRDWGPTIIGVLFALGALLIGTQAVWTAD